MLQLPSFEIDNFACGLKSNIFLHLIGDGVPTSSMQTLRPIDAHSLNFNQILILSWHNLSLVDKQVLGWAWLVIDEFGG